MNELLLILTVLAVVAVISGILIPVLSGRPDTPEKRAERDATLRDELAVW